jgi:hypothetical protein
MWFLQAIDRRRGTCVQKPSVAGAIDTQIIIAFVHTILQLHDEQVSVSRFFTNTDCQYGRLRATENLVSQTAFGKAKN